MEQLAKILLEARVKQGFDVIAVCNRLIITVDRLDRIERGQVLPSPATFNNMASLYGLDPEARSLYNEARASQ